MKYAVIDADPPKVAIVEVDKVKLEFLQKAVGGYIEAIPVVGYKDFPPITMYLNEEGKQLGLEYNPFADALVWRTLIPGDQIVGNVVLCGPPDRNGYDTTLPEEWISYLEQAK